MHSWQLQKSDFVNERVQIESNYDWRRINHFFKNNKVRKILPEILNSDGFEEQPYTLFTSRGTNKRLRNAKSRLFLTGPCIISAADVKNVVEVAKRRLDGKISDLEFIEKQEEILSRQPSLQNIVTIGVMVDNTENAKTDILCKMETLETAMLMAGNDKQLFDKHKEKLLEISTTAAKRIEKMIEKLRKIKGVESSIYFFNTHDDNENKLISEILDYLAKNEIKPRDGSYFLPSDWRQTSKTRIEAMYTKMFTERISNYLKKNYDIILISENVKFFRQIFNGTFILPLDYFDVDRASWVGIVPLPSISSETEMDDSEPLFLGNNLFMKQLDNPNIYRFSLGSYLIALATNEELKQMSDILYILFAKKPDEKENTIKFAKQWLSKRLSEIQPTIK